MKLKNNLTSPLCAMGLAYVYVVISAIVFGYMGLYRNNRFFKWGPPITFFSITIESNLSFYGFHMMIFFHQLINNWVNTVVYPWIINIVQDPKNKKMNYSMGLSLLLINLFDLYSELDVMLIIMGFTSQISFIITITIANVITSTFINREYIRNKNTTMTEEDILIERV